MVDVDLDELVTGTSVEWDKVAGIMVGAVLATVGYALAVSVELVSSAVQTAMDAYGRFLAALVATPFAGAVSVLEAAWSAFAASIVVLGPFAFPATVAMSAVVLYLVFWGVRAFARWRW